MTPDPQPDRGERRWPDEIRLVQHMDFGVVPNYAATPTTCPEPGEPHKTYVRADQALARVEEAQKLADDQHRMAGEIHTQLEEARGRAEKAEQTIAAVREELRGRAEKERSGDPIDDIAAHLMAGAAQAFDEAADLLHSGEGETD